MSDTTPLSIQPPSALLITQTDSSGKSQPAFPLQTTAWIKMQLVVNQALTFPLTAADFTSSYGTFADEGQVTDAVTVLGNIRTTAQTYGDPQTLVSQIASFQQATTIPSTVYGAAVWLAAQTVIASQQILNLLSEGFNDLAMVPADQRLADLTELLTGQGGITSYASTLQTAITSFQTQTQTFYNSLNSELTGPGRTSLKTYLASSDSVLTAAEQDVQQDKTDIDQLTSEIHHLNEEYIGFTVAACASVFIAMIPVVGAPLAIADAATFGTLAALTKKHMDALKSQVSQEEEDERKKAALVLNLKGFNLKVPDVETDGLAFLSAISGMIGGWAQFQTQITGQLNALTPEDLKDWSAFRDLVGFQDAVTGWNNILNTAEKFYQSGFVTFTSGTA